MRHGAGAGRALDSDGGREGGGGGLGEGAEGNDVTRGGVDGALAAVHEEQADELGDVLNDDMIAAFLALAKEADGLAAGGLAAEAVVAVTVVGGRPRRKPGWGAQWREERWSWL